MVGMGLYFMFRTIAFLSQIGNRNFGACLTDNVFMFNIVWVLSAPPY